MNLLSLTGVSKSFRDAPLFEDVTLGIDQGEKIGFIGRNGSGKSTFLRILSGELAADTGVVARNRELTIGAVEQIPVFEPAWSVDDYLERDPGPGPASRGRAAPLDTARSLCRELGILDTAAPMTTLSGGMVRKVSLARCLARGAGFLTLDEPTNHLDLETIEWLERWLLASTGTFILVTHDRYFLDAVCGAILEIDGRRLYKYPGNYTTYLERRAAREAASQRAEQRRATILRRELEWLKRGPKARTGKDKGRIGRAQSLMETGTQRELEMQVFSSAHRRLGKKVVELVGAAKGYDGRTVIAPFTYRFRRGERIGVIGPNGSGKTTFLQLVSGRLAPDSGIVDRGETTVFAHFDQSSTSRSLGITVLDYIREVGDRIPVGEGSTLSAEQFLERFLFPRPSHATALDRLSGGELRRLELVRLLASAPNFLILDEPTNDLDLETIGLLEDYLEDFPGCMLVVSHDRAMLDRLTDYLFLLDGKGGIQGFPGSYADYRDALTAAPEVAKPAAPETRKRPAREKRDELTFRERREYEGLMAEITALEGEQRELEGLFLEPVLEPARREHATRRYKEVERLLGEKTARWEALASRDSG